MSLVEQICCRDYLAAKDIFLLVCDLTDGYLYGVLPGGTVLVVVFVPNDAVAAGNVRNAWRKDVEEVNRAGGLALFVHRLEDLQVAIERALES